MSDKPISYEVLLHGFVRDEDGDGWTADLNGRDPDGYCATLFLIIGDEDDLDAEKNEIGELELPAEHRELVTRVAYTWAEIYKCEVDEFAMDRNW